MNGIRCHDSAQTSDLEQLFLKYSNNTETINKSELGSFFANFLQILSINKNDSASNQIKKYECFKAKLLNDLNLNRTKHLDKNDFNLLSSYMVVNLDSCFTINPNLTSLVKIVDKTIKSNNSNQLENIFKSALQIKKDGWK